ncbi:MAG: mechanosensitive ion channel family protein [Gemmataceae bacterium]
MDFYQLVQDFFADDRLLANLVALHIGFVVVLLVSFILRRLLITGSDRLARLSGLTWLEGLSQEAVRRVRALLFWGTLGAMGGLLLGAVVYHWFGRDVRVDLSDWYAHLTPAQLVRIGLALGELVLLGLGLFVAWRIIKNVRGRLERYTLERLPALTEKAHAPEAAKPAAERTRDHEATVRRWFQLLERFALVTLFLVGLCLAGRIVHLRHVVDDLVLFAIRLLAILMVARLLTLACRTLSHSLAALGNRHLGSGKFKIYWERVTRLFPFGERCFEAAVYISAATLVTRELHFIAFVADFGPRLVQCIGIFFVTRVLIELLTVLLNEGFGIHAPDRPVNQKTETLLPLLRSIGEYTLYFGSAVIMLGVLGIDTTPILAGAGIVGLAAGLGAQSLVTDLVSGFFILFENQYLVGDMVQIGDAEGRVEAVSIRHTQIRDERGKLYIIPNGQVKTVINLSKGYVNAVVDITVPTSQSLEALTADMAEAGRRLRQKRPEVIGETLVQGLVSLTLNDMTLRAITRVQPGKHQAIQLEYRRLLKETLDERRQEAIKQEAIKMAA